VEILQGGSGEEEESVNTGKPKESMGEWAGSMVSGSGVISTSVTSEKGVVGER